MSALFTFTEEDFEEIGVTAKCAPPLRSRSQKEKLWACIQSEEVDMISSDHSPCPIELKQLIRMIYLKFGVEYQAVSTLCKQ